MIDGTALIIAGVVVQAVAPTRALWAALRPSFRGPGMLASIAFTPLPHPTAAPHALVVAIAAPATLER